MMMMMADSISLGVEGGPVSSMNYKRALLRSPPREFTVEVLSPMKHGSNWSYGLKVCPIIRSKRTSDSHSIISHSTSTSASSSYSEYEIWRRWEDCLDFQETLEAEYGKMSRQKVKVLRRGKKKDENSFYSVKNAAASFESLPEGPDPREVAVDVHDLIPSLTRKGTLFRVSRNTVKQRGDEFAAMIRALFNASEDAPVLLQELRNSTPVRDFFGFWRRDKDVQRKTGTDANSLFHSNQSLSSLPSTAPSSPTSSTFSAPRSPTSPFRHSMFMRPKSRPMNDSSRDSSIAGPSTPASAPPGNRRFVPSLQSSQSFTSLRHDRFKTDGSSSMMFTDELLLEDDSEISAEPAPRSRPMTQSSAPLSAPAWGSGSMRPSEHLRPTNPGVPDSIPEHDLPRPIPRARSSSCAAPEYRNARIFASTPDPLRSHPARPNTQAGTRPSTQPHAASPPYPISNRQTTDFLSTVPSPSSSHSASPSSRPSSISMTRFSVTSSVSSYVQSVSKRSSFSRESRRSFDSDASVELDLPFTNSPIVLHTPLSEVAEHEGPDSVYYPRDSFASFASGRTDSSENGVLPQHLRVPMTHRRQRSLSLNSRGGSQTPVTDRQTPSKDYMSEGGSDDFIDSYLDDRADTPEVSTKNGNNRFTSHRAKDSIGSISSNGSLSESHTPRSPKEDAFAVKALYRDSVVVFRAERSMPLETIRERLRDRFVLHESVPLAPDFVLAYLPSRAPVLKAGVVVRRGRSNSAASSTADMSQLTLLQTEVDWQTAAATCGGKVTLRVLDTESSS